MLQCVVSLLLLVLHLYSLHFTSFSNSVLPFVCPFSSCQPVLTEHSLSVCPSVQTSLSAPTSSSHPLSHPWLALLRDDFCHRLKKIKIILGLKKTKQTNNKTQAKRRGTLRGLYLLSNDDNDTIYRCKYYYIFFVIYCAKCLPFTLYLILLLQLFITMLLLV